MNEYQPQDLSEVETLLVARQKLTDWLDKLELAGGRTPAAVRSRVRSDYQSRLSGIVEQLRSHSDVISSTVRELRVHADERDRTRAELQDALSEAELRHAVGEFTDEEWDVVERDSSRKLAVLVQELDRYNGEINRLEEVLVQILPSSTEKRRDRDRIPEPGGVTSRPVEISLVKDEGPTTSGITSIAPPVLAAMDPPEAPRFTPKSGQKGSRDSGSSRAIPFPVPSSLPDIAKPAPAADEMQFLKSMTLDPSRATGGQTTATPATADAKAPERTNPNVAKTLKCGECGALNRPTEWYCERCGAELAAV